MFSRAAPAQSTIDGWIANYFNPTSGVSIGGLITAEFGDEPTEESLIQHRGLLWRPR